MKARTAQIVWKIAGSLGVSLTASQVDLIAGIISALIVLAGDLYFHNRQQNK